MKRYEQVIASVARKAGISVARIDSSNVKLPIETSPIDRDIVAAVRPFSMTSAERIWSLVQAVAYVEDEHIPGALVECGVWRGGSVMAMARKLVSLGSNHRTIWLYDTFEGMTAPTANDVEAATGQSAERLMATTEVGDGNNVWAYATQQDVIANLATTGYEINQFKLVKGDVAQTLQTDVPESIAILRLDTDWYESTKVGLEILYPRLAVGGVCILDDYGHWVGARKAVDDYFAAVGHRPFMHPIDYSGRVFIKTR